MHETNAARASADPPLAVTTTSLPDGEEGVLYAATLTASGGVIPYIWSVTAGSLPSGLALVGATGAIAGIPAATGASTFTVTVTDLLADTASQDLSITIEASLAVATTSLPDAVAGFPYVAVLTATGGLLPYTWSVTAGDLPDGLSLDGLTGTIAGIPTTTGPAAFTVTVTDLLGSTATADLSITTQPTLDIVTVSLPAAVAGFAYLTVLAAVGGIPPYTWSITQGSLPDGLTLDAGLGVIAGTPLVSGTASFTVTVTDAAANTASQDLSVTVAATLSISTVSLPAAVVGAAYLATLIAIGGLPPYTWSITSGALPAGLLLDAATGVISGIPAATGTADFTVTVTDSGAYTLSVDLSITVEATLGIVTTSLPEAVVGIPYLATLVAVGGVLPYTWSITAGSLPDGLTLDAATGIIGGTPTAAGSASFTVTVTDLLDDTASVDLSIAVEATLAIVTTSLPEAVVGIPYLATLVAVGGVLPYTWSVTAGSLPDGLTLDAATGIIGGTPTAAGTASFTVTVTDLLDDTASVDLSITVEATLGIVTTSLPEAVVGIPYLATLVAVGGVLPYTWSITAGSLPDGLTLDAATGIIGGTPTAAGSASFTVTVTDLLDDTASVDLSIAVEATLGIVTTSLPEAVVGIPYLATLVAVGGVLPYTWSVTAGSLPDGLMLDAATGIIGGTPTAAGSASFTVTVTDLLDDTASVDLSITVEATLAIVTTSLPEAVVGIPYLATLVAVGGVLPYTWSVTAGSLPDGLMLDAATGIIGGTPTAAGSASFTVTVTDLLDDTASVDLSIAVEATLGIVTTSLPEAVVGIPYLATLVAVGGVLPYTWSITAGSLPDGLTLDAATGIIGGTPTAAGSASFTVTVTDLLDDTASVDLSITVEATLAIVTTSLPEAVVGIPYLATLVAVGGVLPYTWSITAGSLPDGLTLDAATGVIGGTPTTAGTAGFTVTVTDSASNTASQPLSLTVAATLAIVTTLLPDAVVGIPYLATLVAVGGVLPYTWSITAGSLPDGLTLDAATGVISGTPTTTGGAAFTVTVTDAASNTASQPLSLTVVAVLTIITTSLPEAEVGVGYVAVLSAVGGAPPYTWSITAGSLPDGLTLNSATGVISGTPTTTGTAGFTVTVTDAASNTASQPLSITVAATLAIVTTLLPDAVVGIPYLATLVAVGGVLPYTWSITAGSLPDGLTLDAATGVISGTPTTTGGAAFTVTVTDAASNTASQPLSLTVVAVLTIITASLPEAEVGVGYVAVLSAVGGAPPYTWSITAGSLPDGLTLDAATGVISGTPTTTGTAGFTVTVTDSASNTASQPFSITVAATLAIVTTSLPAAVVGIPYLATLVAVGGVLPYTWSITAGSLPDGLTLDAATGVISGTPTTAGTAGFTVTVTDSASNTASQPLSITVAATLAIVTTLLPEAVVGIPYLATLVAVGGVLPYTWSITAGSLPDGLTLDAATGVIGGTPTTAGTAGFTVTVTDSASNTASQPLSITVVAVLTIITTSLPEAEVGVGYVAVLSAVGGVLPYTWSITAGSLPDGLTLNAATGVIGGTPTTTGTAGFTVTVTDSASNTASQPLSITVAATLAIVTTSLPAAVVGIPYLATLVAVGGVLPYTWSITAGSLPDGLTLNAATGVIGGTPTTAGTAGFTVTVTDSASNTASQPLSITVAATLAIVTTLLPDAVVGIPYLATLVAVGGVLPYTWSITAGSLPDGLTLNAATGVIGGTPTTAGTAGFTVTVTDSASNTASQPLSITVAATLAIVTTLLPDAVVGIPYLATLVAVGGVLPYTWSITAGSLPDGLTLDAATGVISGTPTTTGGAAFTVTVTDAASNTASQPLSLTVVAVLTIITASLPEAEVGVGYVAVLSAVGGAPPYTWSITAGSLPDGLTLDAATGVISGTPTTTGTAGFTVTVTDSASNTASQPLSITVAATLAIVTTSLPAAVVGIPYLATLVAVGGVLPYTWSITAGSLPDGLTLNAATGVIGGTPTTAGTAGFTVTVTDSASNTASQPLSITVAATLAIVTTSLPGAVVGIPYLATLVAVGGVLPYTWSITAGSLPDGLTLNAATGVIGGTPTTAGTAGFTVTVTDSASNTASQPLSITVAATLAIVTTSLPAAVVGIPYLAVLTAIGGVPPYIWSVTAGTLPAGLTLDAATGVISGTPETTGTAGFTITVTDSAANTASQPLAITVAATLSVVTTSLPDGVTGIPYVAVLAAAGGTPPYTWSVTAGSLPAGLSLNAATGVISGTPSAGGTASFTITVTDSAANTASQPLFLTVQSILAVVTQCLADGEVGVPYVAALAATGGVPPYTWAVTGGSLPAGLSLDAATGAISGTPATAGTASFTITVTDSAGNTASQPLSITVAAALAIVTMTLPDGEVGVPYVAALTATGGVPPYTWSVTAGSLPAGLSLDAATGVVGGIPAAAGTSDFTVTVTDAAANTASQPLSITMMAALAIVTASLPGATAGVPYAATLVATGGLPPYTWSITAGSLPAGLFLDPATGVIGGTSATAGTSEFTVTVTDSASNTASQPLSITVAVALAITTTSLPGAAAAVPYAATAVATGGVPPYTWAVTAGSLPAGLSLDAGTGVISGTPATAGTSDFTLTVTDAVSNTASQPLSITVAAALTILTACLPNGIAGVPYIALLAAAGGVPPYTWAVTGGALPAGLSLDAATGVISGTPAGPETAAFTVTVTDAIGNQASADLAITVQALLAIVTASLPNAALAAPYIAALEAVGGTPPYTWSVAAGALPAGMSLGASTGIISGMPVAAGTASFTIAVVDAASNTATKALSITVLPVLIVATACLPIAALGAAYVAPLTAVGGTPPYTWSVGAGSLPSGLALNPATGVISGVPSVSGTSIFTAAATDATAASTSRILSITVL